MLAGVSRAVTPSIHDLTPLPSRIALRELVRKSETRNETFAPIRPPPAAAAPQQRRQRERTRWLRRRRYRAAHQHAIPGGAAELRRWGLGLDPPRLHCERGFELESDGVEGNEQSDQRDCRREARQVHSPNQLPHRGSHRVPARPSRRALALRAAVPGQDAVVPAGGGERGGGGAERGGGRVQDRAREKRGGAKKRRSRPARRW